MAASTMRVLMAAAAALALAGAAAAQAYKAALALEETNVEGNRVLGLLYAAAVDASNERNSAQASANVKQAISYLEKASAGKAEDYYTNAYLP